MKIGIFFGGQSREREVSFAGGRTVHDNLNKELFEPIPIFVDSLGNLILLKWEYIYKGTIRDFYPPARFISNSPFQVYIESLNHLSEKELEELISQVGKRLEPHELKTYIDLAFLALHGPFGEDGTIQGLLEWYGIPYTGSGILPSAIGIDKISQRRLLEQAGFNTPRYAIIERTQWLKEKNKKKLLDQLIRKIGNTLVIKAPQQGSSIGVGILEKKNLQKFIHLVNQSFFLQSVDPSEWNRLSEDEKKQWITQLIDIRQGIGMPVHLLDSLTGEIKHTIYHPEELHHYLTKTCKKTATLIYLAAEQGEEKILIESFIKGKEFSCIVIQDQEGNPIALPPTEISKETTLFDYRSKYLPGMVRKITPINIPIHQIEAIRKECNKLFTAWGFQVYARLDGFITKAGKIYLNDPNTTSGMLPSSFFFHQAAEIGLNPSQFLTYIIYSSLKARLQSGKHRFKLQQLLIHLHTKLEELKNTSKKKIKVAVIMGGYSAERHISMESGRNIYEKLASSDTYDPIPVFLTGNSEKYTLYKLPVSILLKDNADDVKEKITHHRYQHHPIIKKISHEAKEITKQFAHQTVFYPTSITLAQLAKEIDFAFIALHGRPGEDGSLQHELEKYKIPYNGSGVKSSSITINKFQTNEILQKCGISVAKHHLVQKEKWLENKKEFISAIEQKFSYPFIAKPADDGCSAAVKKIKTQDELIAFTELLFRKENKLSNRFIEKLHLQPHEEFPQKDFFLIEELITANGATHFLEVTGGLLTTRSATSLVYHFFEPSETLATGDVLSLEEKFLAGEGQNITPARFSKNPEENKQISNQVKTTLKKVAETLNIEGYARIDAFVRIFNPHQVETIIIEVNSLPGMTPATCIFHQAALDHYKPYEFIHAIIQEGFRKFKKE
jgi:UDP-N-acetylmuramate--alanine ligase